MPGVESSSFSLSNEAREKPRASGNRCKIKNGKWKMIAAAVKEFS
jgi:hypothetical protein